MMHSLAGKGGLPQLRFTVFFCSSFFFFCADAALSIKRAIIQQITRIRRRREGKNGNFRGVSARQPCRAGASAGLEIDALEDEVELVIVYLGRGIDDATITATYNGCIIRWTSIYGRPTTPLPYRTVPSAWKLQSHRLLVILVLSCAMGMLLLLDPAPSSALFFERWVG